MSGAPARGNDGGAKMGGWIDDPVTRRSLLRGATTGLLGTTMIGAVVSACGDDDSGGASGTVTLFTWETYHDAPWLAEYRRAHPNVEIKAVTTGTIDEMYARTRTAPSQFDVLYFDSGSIQRYRDAELIVPMDPSKLPNKKNIQPLLPWQRYNVIDGETWAMPYCWGTQPLMYNADEVREPPTSWGALWDPRYKGKVSIVDNVIFLQTVSLYLGHPDPFDLTDAQFAELEDALDRLRDQVTAHSAGFSDQVNTFASGDAVIGWCQNISEVFELQANGLNVQYTYPKEGIPFWIDCAVLTETGDRPEVYAFIDETMSLPWQARFINTSHNNGILSAALARKADVKPAVLDETNIRDFESKQFRDRLELFEVPTDIERRTDLWGSYKADI